MARTGSPADKAKVRQADKERQSEEDRRADDRRLARLRRHAERRHDFGGGSVYGGSDRRRLRDRRAEDLDRRLAYNRRRSHGRRAGYDRAAGLRRLGIDDTTCKVLLEFQPVLAGHIDSILGDYEAMAAGSPGWAAMKRSRVQRKRHWLEDVFGGRFEGAQMRRRTGLHRSGKGEDLEKPWAICGYNFVLGRVIGLIADTYAKQPEKMKDTLDAVTKAAFLDLDLAVFSYTQSVEELSPWADMLSPEEISFLMDRDR